MKYLIVIEETKKGFSAFSPDLPGYVATGATREEGYQVPVADMSRLQMRPCGCRKRKSDKDNVQPPGAQARHAAKLWR